MSGGDDRLLTAREVGELLSVPERWVLAAAREGRLPHVPLGKYRRFRRESVLAWVEEQERPSARSQGRAVHRGGTK